MTADSISSTFPPELAAKYRAAQTSVRQIDFVSPALSAFWGQPIHIRGQVALPPGYRDSGPRFPVAYSTSGYGGNLLWTQFSATHMVQLMASGEAPPMIWVYLDQSSPTGTHEFADSVNNGPWGQALIAELIPWVDRNYATDGVPSSRFLTGHSSGGWASLWLQVRYPKMFGGSWPTSPDPSDFHGFFNADLYVPNANAYRDANGNAYPMLRDHGKVVATFEQLAKMEMVLGPYGGQDASFEWVFSPKGPDGRPVPMFDRVTGKVNSDVLAYWHDRYDIASIVARDWKMLKPDLDGKIHLYVGADDSFYLDGPAHRLQATFQRLGAHEDFAFVPDKTHFDLMAAGGDHDGLLKTIAWAMYAKARPGSAQPVHSKP
jgi:S-formylglutathione hydrolase FrmB